MDDRNFWGVKCDVFPKIRVVKKFLVFKKLFNFAEDTNPLSPISYAKTAFQQ